MSCHSMVWRNSPLLSKVHQSWSTGTPVVWKRVNWVPEFVFFNHEAHVRAGVNCNVCHGPVQDMALTWKRHDLSMAWCLDCHEDPARFADPGLSPTASDGKSQVFDLYWKLQQHAPLGRYESQLAGGNRPENDDPAAAEKTLKAYGIKTIKLTDCWTCHR